MTPDFPIAVNGSLKATAGDFGVTMSKGKVEVPNVVGIALANLKVRTTLDWFSILETFPESLANELKWSASDVQHAADRLSDVLQIARPTQRAAPFSRGFGALPSK